MGKRIWKKPGTKAWERALRKSAGRMAVDIYRAGKAKASFALRRYKENKTGPHLESTLTRLATELARLEEKAEKIGGELGTLQQRLAADSLGSKMLGPGLAAKARSRRILRADVRKNIAFAEAWIADLRRGIALAQEIRRIAPKKEHGRIDAKIAAFREELGSVESAKAMLETLDAAFGGSGQR